MSTKDKQEFIKNEITLEKLIKGVKKPYKNGYSQMQIGVIS
ncbi:MAG: hypothetical protein SOY28_00345 [Roseburia sp.]|nr:hypothetical protein [Roseburia sp.]